MEFIIFLAIIGLFVYIQNISNRLSKLERAVHRTSLERPQVAPPAPQSLPQSAIHGAPTASMEPNQQPQIPPGSASVSLQLPVRGASLAQWVGGVGVVALLFGLAFFFRFAIEQGWITEVMRILIGVVIGLLFIVLGELWKQKYVKYAQLLTGGGIALLYFTIYASYQYYHRLEQPIAFLCTIVLTIGAVVLAYRYNSKALAALALMGAYISPLLIGSGENRQISLFIYLTLVNVGAVVLLLKEYWVELLFVALLGTGVDFAVWAWAHSMSENVGFSVAFLIFNYLLVAVLTATIFRNLHGRRTVPKETDVFLGIFYALCGFAMFGTITGLLFENFHDYLAPVMALLGVATFLTYAVLDRLEYNRVNYPLSFVGSGFLVVAMLWQFSGQVANMYLLIAASVGIGVGILVKRKDLRTWGLIVLLLATIRVALLGTYGQDYVFVVNARFGLEVLATAMLFACAAAYEKYSLKGDELPVPAITRTIGAAVMWLAVSQEIATYFKDVGSENARNLLLSIWWMVYAVLLMLVGALGRFRVLRKVAIILFAITILKVFLYDVQALELGYRVVSFILLGIILLAVAFAYQRNKDKLEHFLSGEPHA